MEMTDLMPKEKWAELEKAFFEETGFNPTASDKEGMRITDYVVWANELCPRIKGDPKGMGTICSVAQQATVAEIKEKKEPVVLVCDAGMVKFCVPVIVDGEFLGGVGGCGALLDDEELETFMIAKTLEIEEKDVEELGRTVRRLTKADADKAIELLEERIDKIIESYKKA